MKWNNSKGFTLVEISVAIGVGAFILLIFMTAFRIGEGFKKKLGVSEANLSETRIFLRQFDNDIRKTQEITLGTSSSLELMVNRLEQDKLIKERVFYSLSLCDAEKSNGANCITRETVNGSKRSYKVSNQMRFCYPINECFEFDELIPSLLSKKMVAVEILSKNKKNRYLYELQGVMDNTDKTEKWWSL